jgi:hypothetical protein
MTALQLVEMFARLSGIVSESAEFDGLAGAAVTEALALAARKTACVVAGEDREVAEAFAISAHGRAQTARAAVQPDEWTAAACAANPTGDQMATWIALFG